MNKNNPSVVEKFLAHIFKCDIPAEVAAIELPIRSLSSDKRLYCFVEGITDVTFYKNILHKMDEYKDFKIEFFNEGKEGEDGGKEAVYHSLTCLLSIPMKTKCKAAFVVDRDYDENGFKKSWVVNENIVSRLTVLPCYAIENFFFYPECNLESIFKHYFSTYWKKYLGLFQNEFNSYIEDIALYCAWKMLCVRKEKIMERLAFNSSKDSKYDVGTPNYEINNVLRDKNLPIRFKLSDNFYAFMKSVENELNAKKNEALYKKMLKYKDDILKDRRLPKGKLLLGFLIKFLKQHGEKNIKAEVDDLLALSGKLTVFTEFKPNFDALI